ncbi:unnamed protein product [Sphagnum balticum]
MAGDPSTMADSPPRVEDAGGPTGTTAAADMMTSGTATLSCSGSNVENSGGGGSTGLLSQALKLHSESKQLPAMFIEVDKSHRCSMSELDSTWEVSEHPELEVPVLDLAVLLEDSELEEPRPEDNNQLAGDMIPRQRRRQELVKAMAKACQRWGFFQVLNHGVDQALIQRCEAEAHRMFQLPLDVKERVHRPPGASFGYGANTWVNQKVMHWAESFHMQLHPTSNIHDMAAKLFAESDPNQFSSAVEEYMAAVEGLARRLLELLTEGLGLEPGHFNQYLEKERMTSMRFNFYPPCPEPSLAIGLRAHTDPHLLTILHQDSVAGLQVQIDGKWIPVKPRPDCFVVNIGDLFQVLSNTMYKSVLHRAVVNSSSQRLSLACFLNPPLNATVATPPELITPEWPQIYRPFTWLEYLKNAYLYHPITGADRHERFFLSTAASS